MKIKNNKYIGNVIKINYLIFLKLKKKKKKKTCLFVGLCVNKKKNYIKLINKVKKESMKISFDLCSPTIYKIQKLNIYKKLFYRVSKLNFKKNKNYFDDSTDDENIINSNFDSIKINFFFSAFLRRKWIRRKKKIKKLRRKYFRTQKWKKIISYVSFIRNLDENLNELSTLG